LAGIMVVVSAFFSSIEQERQFESIIDLTNKNTELTEKNIILTTGGNNYCYFDFHEVPQNTMRWLIQHGSSGPIELEAPVLDVQGEIIDLTKTKEIRKNEPNISEQLLLRKCTKKIRLGTVTVHDNRELEHEDMGQKIRQTFLINFFARNGNWQEYVVMQRIEDGSWRTARRLILGPDSPYSMKKEIHIDQGFPKEVLKEKEWEQQKGTVLF